LFKRGRTLAYVHNFARWREYRVEAEIDLAAGPHTLAFHFTMTTAAGGEGALLVDGAEIARAEFKRVTPNRYSLTGVGLWCGRGGNLEVCDDYAGTFPWAGSLHQVVVEVRGTTRADAE